MLILFCDIAPIAKNNVSNIIAPQLVFARIQVFLRVAKWIQLSSVKAKRLSIFQARCIVHTQIMPYTLLNYFDMQ